MSAEPSPSNHVNISPSSSTQSPTASTSNISPRHKRQSFNNLKEYRRKDSAASTTSSTEALDFLADMCVEIDEIGSTMSMPSPSPSSETRTTQTLQPHHLTGHTASSSHHGQGHHHGHGHTQKEKKFFPPNFFPEKLQHSDSISPSSSNGQGNKLKRECSEISPRSRSSLTPASSRTLSKGFSFSSVGSNPFNTDHQEALALLNGPRDSFDEDQVVIPLTLYHFGENGVFLVPNNPSDITQLLKGCRQNENSPVFAVSLTHADTLQHHNQLRIFSKIAHGSTLSPISPTSTDSFPSKSPVSSVSAPTSPTVNIEAPVKILNPKHIYKTSCDTYRVQMSKGSKTNPNGKFSRNTRNEVDALWLCEFALLLIERPSSFEDILINGNYKCLLQRKIVSSPEDFSVRMYQQLTELSSRGLLKPVETEKLGSLLQKYVPQYGFSPNGTPISIAQEPTAPLSHDFFQDSNLVSRHRTGAAVSNNHSGHTSPHGNDGLFVYPPAPQSKNILHKAKEGLSSLLSNSFTFNDADQKKRRRSMQTAVVNSTSTSNQENDEIHTLSKSASMPVFYQLSQQSSHSHSHSGHPHPHHSLTQHASFKQTHSDPSISQHSPPNVATSNVRQYPSIAVLTSQYVKQKGRSFEEHSPPEVGHGIHINHHDDHSYDPHEISLHRRDR